MSVTSNNRGHHHTSDFIYASPYELIEKHHDPNNSDIYVPASVSIRMTPPPLPQRNNNYSPPPRMAPISSRSSSSTPPVTRAFPKTPSPVNNDLKVRISSHFFAFCEIHQFNRNLGVERTLINYRILGVFLPRFFKF